MSTNEEERSQPIGEVVMNKFLSYEVSLCLSVCIVILSVITSVFGGNKYIISSLVSLTILIIPFCIIFIPALFMASLMVLSAPSGR